MAKPSEPQDPIKTQTQPEVPDAIRLLTEVKFYLVLVPFRDNDRDYSPGEKIALTAPIAELLLRQGCIRELKPEELSASE